MGCLKNFTRSIFLTIVIVGFTAFFSQNWVKNQVNNFIHFENGGSGVNTQKVGDFSGLHKEYEVEKTVGMLGYNAVLAEHKASGQKMIVVDSGKNKILTSEDIKSENVEQKIKNAIEKFRYQSISVEDFHITNRGEMESYGQKNVPYVEFKAKIKNLPMGEFSGIISVVKDDKGQDKILVSANKNNKYSQVISNEFFKAIK